MVRVFNIFMMVTLKMENGKMIKRMDKERTASLMDQNKKKNGTGKQTLSNGAIYDGDWKDNSKEGKGV